MGNVIVGEDVRSNKPLLSRIRPCQEPRGICVRTRTAATRVPFEASRGPNLSEIAPGRGAPEPLQSIIRPATSEMTGLELLNSPLTLENTSVPLVAVPARCRVRRVEP